LEFIASKQINEREFPCQNQDSQIREYTEKFPVSSSVELSAGLVKQTKNAEHLTRPKEDIVFLPCDREQWGAFLHADRHRAGFPRVGHGTEQNYITCYPVQNIY